MFKPKDKLGKIKKLIYLFSFLRGSLYQGIEMRLFALSNLTTNLIELEITL